MVMTVFSFVGILYDDMEEKYQPDERNNNRFDHVALLCCLRLLKGLLLV